MVPLLLIILPLLFISNSRNAVSLNLYLTYTPAQAQHLNVRVTNASTPKRCNHLNVQYTHVEA
jgi:hypothetical protein